MIDALTGWELAADIHGAGKDVGGRVKTDIKSLDNENNDPTFNNIDSLLYNVAEIFYFDFRCLIFSNKYSNINYL